MNAKLVAMHPKPIAIHTQGNMCNANISTAHAKDIGGESDGSDV